YPRQDAAEQPKGRTQRRILEQLKTRGPLRGRQLTRALGRVEWRSAAERLLQSGAISRRPGLEPPRVSPRTVRTARLAISSDQLPAQEDGLGRAGSEAPARRLRILQVLAAQGAPMQVGWIYKQTGGGLRDLRFFEDRGLVRSGG